MGDGARLPGSPPASMSPSWLGATRAMEVKPLDAVCWIRRLLVTGSGQIFALGSYFFWHMQVS